MLQPAPQRQIERSALVPLAGCDGKTPDWSSVQRSIYLLRVAPRGEARHFQDKAPGLGSGAQDEAGLQTDAPDKFSLDGSRAALGSGLNDA